jgi:dihydrofolate reductase
MPSLSSFISLSLDGCYADAGSGMDWAHSNDPEQAAFTAGNAKGGGRLVFGRVTYDMMHSFWPTPAAAQMMPEVAKGMNAMPKVVFSRSMKKAEWNNTTVLNGDLVANVRKLKSDDGPGMAILGSGSVVAQLMEAGLLDELQVMQVPVSLGGGKRLFDGVKRRIGWTRVEERPFKNGNVFLRYRPS